MWSDQIEISIVPVESTNLPSLTGRLEFCGVEASLSHRIKPETVTISPCLLVFKTSATDVMSGAAGGTYLNGMAIVETVSGQIAPWLDRSQLDRSNQKLDRSTRKLDRSIK